MVFVEKKHFIKSLKVKRCDPKAILKSQRMLNKLLCK